MIHDLQTTLTSVYPIFAQFLKTFDFLKFSGGIEIEHCAKMVSCFGRLILLILWLFKDPSGMKLQLSHALCKETEKQNKLKNLYKSGSSTEAYSRP